MTTEATQIYVEARCASCKRTHMVSQEASEDPKVIKRCPHCLSKRVQRTGMLGFTATREQVEAAATRLQVAQEDEPDDSTLQ